MKIPLDRNLNVSPRSNNDASSRLMEAHALWGHYIRTECWDPVEALGRALWSVGLMGADKLFSSKNKPSMRPSQD